MKLFLYVFISILGGVVATALGFPFPDHMFFVITLQFNIIAIMIFMMK